MLKIIINGFNGKIGKFLSSLVEKDKELEVVAGIDKFISPDSDIPQFTSIIDCNVKADVLIDFSRPDALEELLNYGMEKNLPLVIATTGLDVNQQSKIKLASKKIPIFQSTNMSLGINLLIDLAKSAGKFLGNNYDIEIVEQHHNQKVDAPSGTALTIAEEINNEVFGGQKHFQNGRDNKNKKREGSEIGIHAVRGGNIVGKHSVMFIGNDEIIDITHEAQSRQVFAYGALKAAKFISDKKSGLYSMKDIIGKEFSVTTVLSEPGTALFYLNDFEQDKFAEILEILDNEKINIDMIAQTVNKNLKSDISFTVSEKDYDKTDKLLSIGKYNYESKSALTKITVEGIGMEHQSGVAKKVLSIFKSIHADIFAITTSKRKITCLANEDREKEILSEIKKTFNIKI